MPGMDKLLRDGRIVAAIMVWGAELERGANADARRRTPGLNFRDLLLLRVVFDLEGTVLPGRLIGPVYTTGPGVTGSLRRLEQGGLVRRGRGDDLRTRPVVLTEAAHELAAAIAESWAALMDQRLERLDEHERAELYRLLVKGSGLWDAVWPEKDEDD